MSSRSLLEPSLKPRLDPQPQSRKLNDGLTPKKQLVLFVSPVSADQAALYRILKGSNWEVLVAATCQEALDQLRRHRVALTVCESTLKDGGWKEILQHITQTGDAPLLIVTSPCADEHLWAEVLNLGGYDVLATPFRDSEVWHVLTTASHHLIMN
jgi:CheY-like chemotaxis protein